MNLDNAKKWVVALRSGDYPQTTGLLSRVDAFGSDIGFCCLGVACKIANISLSGDMQATHRAYMLVGEWLGLATERMSNNERSPYREAVFIDLNDQKRKTFSEIADVVEAEIAKNEIRAGYMQDA